MLEKLMKSNIILINIYGYFLYVRRYISYLLNKKYLIKNENLKSKNETDKIYIIGTAPSLKNVDLKKIKGKTMVLNNFYKYDSPKEFTPDYIMIIDNIFYRKNEDLIINTLTKYPQIKLILNGKYLKNIRKKLNSLNNVYLINIWKGYFSEKKEIDFSKVESSFINVSCCAVAYAMYLGYKEINLLGVDFNSFIEKKSHCYDENKSFSNIKNDLYGFSLAIDTHEKLYNYALKRGIIIKNINNMDNTLLDVYPIDEKEYRKLCIK